MNPFNSYCDIHMAQPLLYCQYTWFCSNQTCPFCDTNDFKDKIYFGVAKMNIIYWHCGECRSQEDYLSDLEDGAPGSP